MERIKLSNSHKRNLKLLFAFLSTYPLLEFQPKKKKAQMCSFKKKKDLADDGRGFKVFILGE